MMWLFASLAFGFEVEVPAVSADIYRVSTDGGRWVVADDAKRLDGFSGSVGVHWAHQPLVAEVDGEVVEVVSGLLAVDLAGAWGWGPIRVGLTAPAYAWVGSEVYSGWPTALGDGTLDLKVTIREPVPVGVAVVGRLGVPLGGWRRAVGQQTVWWELGLLGEIETGNLGVVLEVGTRGLPVTELENIDVDDQFWFRFGGSWRVNTVDVGLEGWGHLQYSELDNIAAPVLELMLTATHRTEAGRRLWIGAGSGVTRGIGTPVARVALGIGHRPPGIGVK